MPSSLLLLLDDVASMLDDVSALTKVAAKKTAGVLGDDLALNANQVAGVLPARELAVVWRVACGSAVNKLVLVPAALALSWLAPWAVTPLLMAGGAYLCYEGAEKILHRLLHRPHAGRDARSPETRAAGHGESHGDHQASERDRVAGAVRTDFILATAPWLMRGLSIAGTAAMFLVGGGIMSHGMPVMHRMLHDAAARLVGTGPGSSPWIGPLSAAADAAVGLAVGLRLAGVMLVGQRWTPFGSPSRGRTS
ncbi:MAG: DUF808 family protein [Planctomycetota bacterium]